LHNYTDTLLTLNIIGIIQIINLLKLSIIINNNIEYYTLERNKVYFGKEDVKSKFENLSLKNWLKYEN